MKKIIITISLLWLHSVPFFSSLAATDHADCLNASFVKKKKYKKYKANSKPRNFEHQEVSLPPSCNGTNLMTLEMSSLKKQQNPF